MLDKFIVMNEPPIVFAVRAKDIQLVQKRINMGLDISYIDKNGENALNAACRRSEFEIIKLLMKSGANPEWIDGNGQTAFQVTHGNGMVLAILNGEDETMVEISDDNFEITKIKIKPGIERPYTDDAIIGMMNMGGRVELNKAKYINAINIESDANDICDDCKNDICELVNYIAINENEIMNAVNKRLYELNIDQNKVDSFKSWSIYVAKNGKMSVIVAKSVDGEHDLNISFGINKLVKLIWVE